MPTKISDDRAIAAAQYVEAMLERHDISVGPVAFNMICDLMRVHLGLAVLEGYDQACEDHDWPLPEGRQPKHRFPTDA